MEINHSPSMNSLISFTKTIRNLIRTFQSIVCNNGQLGTQSLMKILLVVLIILITSICSTKSLEKTYTMTIGTKKNSSTAKIHKKEPIMLMFSLLPMVSLLINSLMCQQSATDPKRYNLRTCRTGNHIFPPNAPNSLLRLIKAWSPSTIMLT